jgi:hypothetical protein
MHQMRISTTQVSSVMLRSKKLEIRMKKKKKWKLKEPSDENQTECHEIECLREIILRFEMNLQILFSWQFNSYSYFKASLFVCFESHEQFFSYLATVTITCD